MCTREHAYNILESLSEEKLQAFITLFGDGAADVIPAKPTRKSAASLCGIFHDAADLSERQAALRALAQNIHPTPDFDYDTLLNTDGERMDVEAFFREIPETNRHVELRDGIVRVMPSHSRIHQRVVAGVGIFLTKYHDEMKSDALVMYLPCDVILDNYNVVQPDILIGCAPAKIGEHWYDGAPDFIAEVTGDNYGDDYRDKLLLYRQHGVREYWIVDTDSRKVIVYDFDQHPNVVEFYDWADEIPVRIYGGALKIRIEDLT